MKRDMDLIRELLLKLEALPMRRGGIVSITPHADEIAVAGYDVDQIEYHLSQITPAGHDFLDSVRDPETWSRTKKAAAGAGGFTLELLSDLAKGFIKKQIEDRTGVKL